MILKTLKIIVAILVLGTAGFYLLTDSSELQVSSPEQVHYMRDNQGRALVLHGVNDDNCAKRHHLPCAGREMIEKEAALGFNFVRYLTSWLSIEPERGHYDEAYLDAMEERFDWYHDNGIRVMIDMHVDLYGPAVGGNGHPEWATVSDTDDRLPFDVGPWWINYLSGAVSTAYRNFWDYDGEHRWIQDRYIALWRKVAERFRDHPAVFAYDIINEPYNDLSFGGDFEVNWLHPFYQRVINAIREVDGDSYIMYQPRILATDWGFGSYLPPLQDPRASGPRLVYAPHLYPFFSHEGTYDDFGLARRHDLRMMYNWSQERSDELNEHQVPLLIGEFGMAGKPFSTEMINFSLEIADAMGASWTWWDNTPCKPGQLLSAWCLFDTNLEEAPKANLLSRPYPRAIAGDPLSFGFDPDSRRFHLTFKVRPDINDPTEIYLPAARHYPRGWRLHSTAPENSWRYSWDAVSEKLLIWIDRSEGEFHFEILPQKKKATAAAGAEPV